MLTAEFYILDNPNEISAFVIFEGKDCLTIAKQKGSRSFIFTFGEDTVKTDKRVKGLKKITREEFMNHHLPKVDLFKSFIEEKLK